MLSDSEADVVVSPANHAAYAATPHQSKIKDFCQLLLKEKPFQPVIANQSADWCGNLLLKIGIATGLSTLAMTRHLVRCYVNLYSKQKGLVIQPFCFVGN